MLSIVVAVAENGIIGKDNSLLWHIREDMRMFRALTSSHMVIMGRKTFESLGRPLPNRRNVVISSSLSNIDGCDVVHSVDEARKLASGEEEAFIIGGARIYSQFIDLADRMYITEVHHPYEGDASFPEFDKSVWREVSRQDFERGEEYGYPFSFVVLERII